jgi:hypothetical protein
VAAATAANAEGPDTARAPSGAALLDADVHPIVRFDESESPLSPKTRLN